jgi:antitoxin ParD1/3/4
MTITLRPELAQLLQDIMRTGGYEKPEEAIGSALEMLLSQNEWLAENASEVDARIREGIAQLDRGEGIPEAELAAHLARLKAQAE